MRFKTNYNAFYLYLIKSDIVKNETSSNFMPSSYIIAASISSFIHQYFCLNCTVSIFPYGILSSYSIVAIRI